MRGLMMDTPLSIISLIDYAARYHGEVEIVSSTETGSRHRYTYRDAFARVGRLAHALEKLGVGVGDRVATLAWNGYRHFELYYAISGTGAVCHTVNPRLFKEQIAYILNHAEDRIVFVDAGFVPLLDSLAPSLGHAKVFVVMADRAAMPQSGLQGALCYEELIAGESETFPWPILDEHTASSLCYTSGTTGLPKGVLYTHRSTVLHSFAACLPDNHGYSSHDTVLPVVPMFHVNAWGIPYASAMVGAKLVFAGPHTGGAALYELIESEGVTVGAGITTVWLNLLEYLRTEGKRFTTLERLNVGGSSVPRAMIEAFEETYGIELRQGWGMTEISPIGSMGRLKIAQARLDRGKRYAYKSLAGRPLFGVELKIADADDRALPPDGASVGELRVRGSWVAGSYYENDEANAQKFDAEGWLCTGDMASMDGDGYLRIVDRTKDVIKSGGEWISSIDVENAAVGHPDIAEAAVIGLPHPKWGERPLLILVARSGTTPTREQILAYVAGRVARYAVPDDAVFVDVLPHTATGKIQKSKLREDFRNHKLPIA